MAKKIILALTIVVIIVAVFAFILTQGETVNVYIDGENVSVETNSPLDNNNQLKPRNGKP